MNFEIQTTGEPLNPKEELKKTINDFYFALKKGEITIKDTQHEDFKTEAEKLDKDFARNLPARGLEGDYGPDVVNDSKKLISALEHDFQGQFWGSFYALVVEEDKQPAGLGYSAKNEGFMLIGTPGKPFNRENLSAVLIPRQYEILTESLKFAYPEIRFITVDEIKDLPSLINQAQ